MEQMRSTRDRCAVVAMAALCASLFALMTAWGQDEFPLKDGDTWVMVGDSLTAMQMHSQYFEAYCFARFPQWTFHFRNSGVGGNAVPDALARFDWDVAAWKPTVVSVELGMNDHRWLAAVRDNFIANMTLLTERIERSGARPVFFSPSPINDGVATTSAAGAAMLLDKYTTDLRALAVARKAPFADQFHALVNVWADNKSIEDLHHLAGDVTETLKLANDMPGREHLTQWLKAWEKSDMRKKGADLSGPGGNPVHPGPAGQLTMCAALLQGLKAPGLVSKAALDAAGRICETTQCHISNVIIEPDGGLSFDRLDDCLPMPIPKKAIDALIVYPSIADCSQWMLTVTRLKAGHYQLVIDGVDVAVVTAEELAMGWNMGTLDKGPVASQGREILNKVALKERLVSQWRQQAAILAKTPDDKSLRTALDKLNTQILDADAAIRNAAQPKRHRFAVTLTR